VNTAPASKRVLLVDDHPAFLDRLTEVLADEFEVAGALRDGTEVEAAVARSHPDLVVLDITLPGLNGFELAHRLTVIDHPPRIVFLTVHEDADFAREAFAVGGLGYVTKPQLAKDLLPALRAAMEGKYFVSRCAELSEFIPLNGTRPLHHPCDSP